MLRKMSLVMAAALACTGATAFASDHLDAPIVKLDGRTDLNDLYAFRSPTNPNNTVLVMTVNPLAGELSPKTFSANASYDFKIDNTGDAIPDLTYRARFSAPVGLNQTLTVTRQGAAYASGATGTNLTTTVGGKATAGTFDDPFFFDLAGFQNGFAFTGADFFAHHNTSAIVLEVPSAELGGPNISVWVRTADGTTDVQIDRIGRPAIATALIPVGKKDAFNAGVPANDPAAFGADVIASITGLSNAANAAALTPILLPDVLTFDTSNSAGFLNGRKLGDDVIDAELGLLSAGAVTGDGVNGNDVAFSGVFPYLGAAQIVPEPTSIAALAVSLLLGGRRRNQSV